ncbi:hypothetical protein CesoFtcFv8_005559 [Champsocephalus esox]|uniref:MADF domain-containing protein n=1 Tax=Champsocephalus esox TaxID=159716 RepID=A0AAN8CSS0_9TELE|nr:hypothetical protein CesoFtcFv8_005559 [Champsocephalus esox]
MDLLCMKHIVSSNHTRDAIGLLHREVLQKRGVEELLTPTQLSKRWDTLKRKYKELKTPPTGTGTDAGEATAATWSWFSVMHEAIGSPPSMEPPVLGRRGPQWDWAAPCGQAMEEEKDPGQPGTRSGTTTLDEEPCANQYIVIKILTSRDRPCVFFDGRILSGASRDWRPSLKSCMRSFWPSKNTARTGP